MEGEAVVLPDGTMLWTAVEGEGPPIVLIHGGPGLWDYFAGLADDLARDHTIHRWDQRGCGRSAPSPDYDLDVAVGDVHDLKDRLGVDEPWVVLGHSWGAYLALLTTLHHPEETLALIYISGTGAPGWWRDEGSARYRAEQLRRMSDEEQRRLVDLKQRDRSWDEEIEYRRLSWFTDMADWRAPPSALDAMANVPLTINRSLNQRLSTAGLYPDEELLARCGECEVPSLYIHGDADPRPPDGARTLCESMPRSRMVTIPGAGHFPWIERPRETLDAVGTFLRDLSR